MEKTNDYLIVHPDSSVYFIKNYFLLVLVLFITIIFVALTWMGYVNFIEFSQLLMVVIVLTLLLVICLIYSILFCKNTIVTLESNQIIYQTGIFSSKRQIISLDSIIDTSLEKSILDKLLGSAKLNVTTAGSRSFDASISNVGYNSANELHERIHEKIRTREKKHLNHQN